MNSPLCTYVRKSHLHFPNSSRRPAYGARRVRHRAKSERDVAWFHPEPKCRHPVRPRARILVLRSWLRRGASISTYTATGLRSTPIVATPGRFMYRRANFFRGGGPSIYRRMDNAEFQVHRALGDRSPPRYTSRNGAKAQSPFETLSAIILPTPRSLPKHHHLRLPRTLAAFGVGPLAQAITTQWRIYP